MPDKPWAVFRLLLACAILAPFFILPLQAQAPACQQRGVLTSAAAFASFANNTSNPNCNSWALTWNSTGFGSVTIAFEGSDDNSTFTAFTGSSTVVVGVNPTTALSGAIIVQASTTNAYVRVNITSVSGSGSVGFQLFGYSGVTPTAKLSGGGGGCGSLSGDVTGPCSSNTVVKVNGAAVPASASLLASNSSRQLINGNPMTTLGDLIYGGASGAPVRLPGATANSFLVLSQQGTGTVSAVPQWVVPPLTGSLTYYFSSVASDIATYLQMNTTPYSPATTIPFAGVAGTATTTLQNWATGVLNPGAAFFPAGSYIFHVHASRTGAVGTIGLQCQFVEVNAAGVDIAVIGTSAPAAPLNTVPDTEYISEFTNSETYKLASTTSRIVARVQAVSVGVSVASTVNIYVGPAQDSSIALPINGTIPGVSSVFGNPGPIVGATGDIGATGQVVGINGAGIPVSATLTATNGSKQLTAATLSATDIYVGSASNLPVGVAVSGDTSLTSTGLMTVNGLKGVPFCAGFTPANGQSVQYTTGLSPNPCYTAAPGGGGSGGGALVYSGSTVSYVGTLYFAVGGGATVSATEAAVQTASPAAATVGNLYVQLSAPLGAGNTVVYTFRRAGANTTLTCTITGASATACNDVTHSFNAGVGDLLDIRAVTTGTVVATPVTVISSSFGTSGVGITSVFGNSGPSVGATGDIGATGTVVAVNSASIPLSATLTATNASNQIVAAPLTTGNIFVGNVSNLPAPVAMSGDATITNAGVVAVKGVNGVPLCTGFTPTNGQLLQYTTGLSPNPCYTSAISGTPSFASVTGGTNTTAAMVVGSGASLVTTGTGNVSATSLNGVPFCSGFTPTTGQNLQYSTALSPNPCYTAAAGGGGGCTPSLTQMCLAEDFISGNSAFGQIGVLGWGTSATGGSLTYPQTGSLNANHPGQIMIYAGGTLNQYSNLFLQANVTTAQTFTNLPASVWSMSWVMQQNGLTGHRLNAGFVDNTGNPSPGSGIYLQVTNGASNTPGHWFCVTNNSGTQTATDMGAATAIPVNTWQTLTISSDGAGNITCKVNSTSVTNTTNLYTGNLSVEYNAVCTTAGASANWILDYFSLNYALTR